MLYLIIILVLSGIELYAMYYAAEHNKLYNKKPRKTSDRVKYYITQLFAIFCLAYNVIVLITIVIGIIDKGFISIIDNIADNITNGLYE